MNAQKSPPTLLQEISRIQTMERGKLSVIRESSSGPFYKLQAREHGKNRTRYVPRDQVKAVQEAVAGYQLYQSLTGEYAQQVIQRTRESISGRSKKKRTHRSLSSPKARKSSGS